MKSKLAQNFYTPLFVIALLITSIGLVNLYSATVSFQAAGASSFFTNQSLYHLLGILLMFVVMRFQLKTLYFLAPVAYVTALALLVAVLVMGSSVHGSLSWLDLGVVRLQPSEFGKLGLIFMLSRYLSGLSHKRALGLKGLVKPSLIALVPMALVLLQKDLGSSLFFGLIFITLTMLQGIRWHLIIIGLILVIGVGVVAYHSFMLPYQKKRIVSFMNPELDPRGSGYHLVQSKIAVGSGKTWGRGYLKGASNKLKFLPERHTDFIFPVLAEEWGFFGGFVTLTAYLFFLLHGINIASRSYNRFGFFLGIGMVALFFWHMVINLGGVLGLLPLTGVPLPLLSYGGSSLLTNWIAIGVLLALYRSRLGYVR